jgi:hypothetical protein
MACWSEGQRHKMSMRPDWDAVKVDIMYRYAGGVRLSTSPLHRIPSEKLFPPLPPPPSLPLLPPSPPPHSPPSPSPLTTTPAESTLPSTSQTLLCKRICSQQAAKSSMAHPAPAGQVQVRPTPNLEYLNSVMIVAGRSCAQLELVEWFDTGLLRGGGGRRNA